MALPHKTKINWQDLPWVGKNGYLFWLEQNVGKYSLDWDHDDHYFYFKNANDAIMFTLRWS